MCKDLTKNGNLLEGTSLTPHMATNEDWAAVAYFSNSLYGIDGGKKPDGGELDDTDRKMGIELSTGSQYRSTTGNITGIMNMGKNPEYTAGLIADYTNISNVAGAWGNPSIHGESLIADKKDGKTTVTFFENTTSSKNVLAINGWYGSTAHVAISTERPYSYRDSLFGFSAGHNGGAYFWRALGSNYNKDTTFRVVIWN